MIFHENIPTTTKQKDNDENEDTNVVDTVFFFAIDLQQTECTWNSTRGY